MNATATVLWFCNLFLNTAGQLAFKAGARHGHADTLLAGWRRMFSSGWLWFGIVAFVVEFFMWLAFLSLVPLSIAVMVGSFNILTVMIGGRLFFREPLTPRRITAVTLIGCGVALVGWS